jgi:hypothetical protein
VTQKTGRLARAIAPLAALALASLSPAVQADTVGSAASSASSAGSASVGSLSDSVQGSSRSSAGDKPVTAGDYKVIAVTAVAGMPGQLNVRLERLPAADTPAGSADTVDLRLPEPALAGRPLREGDAVRILARGYGLAFARPAGAETNAATAAYQTFYLAVTDTWQRELPARPLHL